MESSWIRRHVGARRSRAALALVALVLCLLSGWAILRTADGSRPTQELTATGEPASAPAPAEAAASAPAAASFAVDSDAVEEAQLCGGVWVKAGPDGQVSAADAAAAALRTLDTTRTDTLAAMDAGDERAQAAAHFYRYGFDRALETCRDRDPCTRPTEAQHREADAERTALVRLAQSSTDPQVYAWAYRSCSTSASRSESPCQLVTSAQWARLDPGNATPWLFMAAEAEKRGDASALDDAMFHVANAQTQEQRYGLLAAIMIQHAPAGEAHFPETFSLATEADGVDAAAGAPIATEARYCSGGRLADANRRESCEGITRLLVERSNTFPELAVGVRLAKRLGWAPERIWAIEEENAALHEAAAHDVSSTAVPRSCSEFGRALTRFREIGSEGELGWARRVMAASGKTPPVLAAEYQRSRPDEPPAARNADAAASEDSVASAASATSAASAASAAADRSEN